MNREKNVLEVSFKSDKKLQTVVSRSKSFLKDYSSSIEKVKEFYQTNQTSPQPRRKKREAKPPESLRLLKKEQKSILELYKSYDELSDEQKVLLQELEKSTEVSHKALSQERKLDRAALEQILKRIGWTTEDFIEAKSKKHKSPNKFNYYGWFSWARSPYKHFLDSEEEFFKLVNSKEEVEQALAAYLRRKRWAIALVWLGKRVMDDIYWEKAKYEEAIDKVKAGLDIAVAAKILSWMNQWKSEALEKH